jgi:hypothetical protein
VLPPAYVLEVVDIDAPGVERVLSRWSAYLLAAALGSRQHSRTKSSNGSGLPIVRLEVVASTLWSWGRDPLRMAIAATHPRARRGRRSLASIVAEDLGVTRDDVTADVIGGTASAPLLSPTTAPPAPALSPTTASPRDNDLLPDGDPTRRQPPTATSTRSKLPPLSRQSSALPPVCDGSYESIRDSGELPYRPGGPVTLSTKGFADLLDPTSWASPLAVSMLRGTVAAPDLAIDASGARGAQYLWDPRGLSQDTWLPTEPVSVSAHNWDCLPSHAARLFATTNDNINAEAPASLIADSRPPSKQTARHLENLATRPAVLLSALRAAVTGDIPPAIETALSASSLFAKGSQTPPASRSKTVYVGVILPPVRDATCVWCRCVAQSRLVQDASTTAIRVIFVGEDDGGGSGGGGGGSKDSTRRGSLLAHRRRQLEAFRGLLPARITDVQDRTHGLLASLSETLASDRDARWTQEDKRGIEQFVRGLHNLDPAAMTTAQYKVLGSGGGGTRSAAATRIRSRSEIRGALHWIALAHADIVAVRDAAVYPFVSQAARGSVVYTPDSGRCFAPPCDVPRNRDVDPETLTPLQFKEWIAHTKPTFQTMETSNS